MNIRKCGQNVDKGIVWAGGYVEIMWAGKSIRGEMWTEEYKDSRLCGQGVVDRGTCVHN